MPLPFVQPNGLAQLTQALANKQWFKVIAGASLSDAPLLQHLAMVYAQAGATCLDIGPHPTLLPVLEGVAHDLAQHGHTLPPLMVSLDVDGDPHFRKVAVEQAACIACGECLPLCPTQALSLTPDPQAPLGIHLPACYGCDRCVADCPTQALSMVPLPTLPQPMADMLAHPLVQAVELHVAHLHPDTLHAFWQRLPTKLWQNKLVSLCFRPAEVNAWEEAETALLTLNQLARRDGATLMLQVDGKPMSGTTETLCSLPALEGVKLLLSHCPWLTQGEQAWPITLSGGINHHTPALLQQHGLAQLVCGAGLGTVARQWVGSRLTPHPEAVERAKQLVNAFCQSVRV